jgi:hypothetical protein
MARFSRGRTSAPAPSRPYSFSTLHVRILASQSALLDPCPGPEYLRGATEQIFKLTPIRAFIGPRQARRSWIVRARFFFEHGLLLPQEFRDTPFEAMQVEAQQFRTMQFTTANGFIDLQTGTNARIGFSPTVRHTVTYWRHVPAYLISTWAHVCHSTSIWS